MLLNTAFMSCRPLMNRCECVSADGIQVYLFCPVGVFYRLVALTGLRFTHPRMPIVLYLLPQPSLIILHNHVTARYLCAILKRIDYGR